MQANGVPDVVISNLLGKGWSYTDWQRETTRLEYAWSEGLRLRIIKKEYLLFKLEIGQLLSQPNTNGSLKSRSNSYKSITRRIKGKTGERHQRLQEGRLFGCDGKPHTLENYVKKWRIEDPSFGFTTSRSPNDGRPITGNTDLDTQISIVSPPLSLSQQNTPSTTAELTSDTLNSMDIANFDAISSSDFSPLPVINNDFQHDPYHLNPQSYLGTTFQGTGFIIDQDILGQQFDYFTSLGDTADCISEAVMENGNLDELLHLQMLHNPTHDGSSTTPSLNPATSPFPPKLWDKEVSHPALSYSLSQDVQTSGQANGWSNIMSIGTSLYDGRIPLPGELSNSNMVPSQDLMTLLGRNMEIDLGTDERFEVRSPDPTSQTSVAAHSRSEAISRTRSYGAVAREARLRRMIIHLHCELQQTRIDMEVKLSAAAEDIDKKDAKIMELERRLSMMELSSKQPSWETSTHVDFGNMEGVLYQHDMMDQLLHQRVNDQILQEAREQKKRALAQRAASEASYNSIEDTASPHRTRFSSKGIRIVPASSDKHATRYPPRQPSIDDTQQNAQPLSSGKETGSGGRSRSSSESSVAQSVRRLMRKVSDGIMRKPHKEEARPPPVPEVPPPVRHQLSEVHKDITKRLTTDSGYASLSSARTSVVDPDHDAIGNY